MTSLVQSGSKGQIYDKLCRILAQFSSHSEIVMAKCALVVLAVLAVFLQNAEVSSSEMNNLALNLTPKDRVIKIQVFGL